MKVTPVQAVSQVQQPAGNTQSAQAARERAIAKLTAQPQAQMPVADPNNISPEEMTAVKPAIQQTQATETIDKSATTDTQVEQVQEAQKPQDEMQSKQLAALVRREKALRAKAQQQEQAWKAKEAELAAKEQELRQKEASFDQTKYISKDRFKQNPLEVMAETGLSYDELVQQVLNQQPLDPRVNAQISKLEAEIKRLQEANENNQKSQQKAQDDAYQAAVKQIRTEVTKLTSSDPNYETIKATNSINDVVELIERTFREEGVMMTVEEAAQEVENYLIEEAEKLFKINKIKSKFQSASTPVKTEQKQPAQPQQQQPMKTLTNATASTRTLSARERAILAFKGESKS